MPTAVDVSPMRAIATELSSVGGKSALAFDEPEPQHRFIVTDDRQPGPTQIRERDFLRGVAVRVMAREGAPGASQDEEQIATTVALMTALVSALRSYSTLEAFVRAATRKSRSEILHPAKMMDELAEQLIEQVHTWKDPPPEELERYNDDELKTDALKQLWKTIAAETPDLPAAAAAAVWPATTPVDIDAHMKKVSTARKPGASKSSGPLGGRVHSFVQAQYCIEHPMNHVICDGRWRHLGSWTARLSNLMNEKTLTATERREYSVKIEVLRKATQVGPNKYVRPDITDLDADLMFEIKPRNLAREGYEELHRYYIPLYNRYALLEVPPLTPMRGGWWTPLPLYLDLPTKSVVLIENAGHGVIVYDVFEVPKEVFEKLLATGVSLALLAAAAKAGARLQLPHLPPPPAPEPTGFALVLLIIFLILTAPVSLA